MLALRILLLTVLGVASTSAAQRLLAVRLAEDVESISDRLGISDQQSALIDTHWTNRETQKLLELAQKWIAKKPHDYKGHALRYVIQLELQKDRKTATESSQATVRRLHKHPLALAKFVRFALLAEPKSADYQLARMALAGVVPDNRKHAAVRTTHLRALLGAGRVKEALATNKTIVQDLADDLDGLTDLLHVICDSAHRQALAGLAREALARLSNLDADSESTRLVRYRVLHGLLDRPAEARKIATLILGRIPDADLNDWTWDLMAKRENSGRYLPLALLAAKRLAGTKELLYHEFDTMALAWFLNGHVQKAVELQERSLAKGGNREPAYVRRLTHYKTTLLKRRTK